MKKIIILFALLLAMLLTSCGTSNESTDTSNDLQIEQTSEETTPAPKVTSLNSYTALGYEISVGNEIDYNESKMYTGEKFGLETITNNNTSVINVNLENVQIKDDRSIEDLADQLAFHIQRKTRF